MTRDYVITVRCDECGNKAVLTDPEARTVDGWLHPRIVASTGLKDADDRTPDLCSVACLRAGLHRKADEMADSFVRKPERVEVPA